MLLLEATSEACASSSPPVRSSPLSPRSEEEFVEDLYVYLKGSMIIDIADAASGKMVWRSDAVRYLALNPEIDSKTIAGGVKRALRKFPPQ